MIISEGELSSTSSAVRLREMATTLAPNFLSKMRVMASPIPLSIIEILCTILCATWELLGCTSDNDDGLHEWCKMIGLRPEKETPPETFLCPTTSSVMVTRFALARLAPVLNAARQTPSTISRSGLRGVRAYASESQHSASRVITCFFSPSFLNLI